MQMPVGDDIKAPQKHPVQCTGTRHQCLSVGRGDDLCHQLIYDRIMHPRHIAAAFLQQLFRCNLNAKNMLSQNLFKVDRIAAIDMPFLLEFSELMQ